MRFNLSAHPMIAAAVLSVGSIAGTAAFLSTPAHLLAAVDTTQPATTHSATTQAASDPAAVELLKKVQFASGADKLAALKDVQYTYTVTLHAKGDAIDVSQERYIFAGEKSWAQFTQRGAFLPTTPAGDMIQGYDGVNAWATLDGKPVNDTKLLQLSRDLRKTNFYWFAMFSKLLDGGSYQKILPPRKVGDIEYQIVELTFDQGVGDVNDKYVLYVNPKTSRVDQFLFTALSFGIVEPMLMTVQYTDVDGFAVPAHRKFGPADWNGTKKADGWFASEDSTNIKFNNNFDTKAFAVPTAH
jgi:hypothetical protein